MTQMNELLSGEPEVGRPTRYSLSGMGCSGKFSSVRSKPPVWNPVPRLFDRPDFPPFFLDSLCGVRVVLVRMRMEQDQLPPR